VATRRPETAQTRGGGGPLLTVEQVPEPLNISRRSVYNIINAGDLETINVGTKLRPRLRVRPAEIDRFLTDRTARVS